MSRTIRLVLHQLTILYRYSWYKSRYDFGNHTGPDGWYLSSVNTLLNENTQSITAVGEKYLSTGSRMKKSEIDMVEYKRDDTIDSFGDVDVMIEVI